MSRDLIPSGSSVKVVEAVKNDLLTSNLLQLREIEKFKRRHPNITMDQAAMVWIDKNAAAWRSKHPLAI